ncbi:MAG: TetR/AcrR family transcriptional regulator [Cytophagales bacterium]|nr:TetR/AcrR family transcriptional regulator [Cytophagales bacterium]
MPTLTFKLNDHLYVRDPQHTQLGLRIISKSIEMIDELGFEQFTFKKLAHEIDSTEASIYRYFENKHRLLLYLIAWYWNWLEYRIDFFTSAVADPKEKLRACLRVIAEEKKYDPTFEFVNEEALHRIVIAELDKTYLTKGVDGYNQEGLFGGFKSLCKKISGIILQINPAYEFAPSLVSTILVTANQQLFFANHLPTLTALDANQERYQKLYNFLENMAFRSIQA